MSRGSFNKIMTGNADPNAALAILHVGPEPAARIQVEVDCLRLASLTLNNMFPSSEFPKRTRNTLSLPHIDGPAMKMLCEILHRPNRQSSPGMSRNTTLELLLLANQLGVDLRHRCLTEQWLRPRGNNRPDETLSLLAAALFIGDDAGIRGNSHQLILETVADFRKHWVNIEAINKILPQSILGMVE